MDFSAFSEKCFTSNSGNCVINGDLVGLHHQRNFILNELNDQRKDGYFCDVALHCRGDTLYAHRCVISCVSKYFKALFTSPLSSASSTPVHSINLGEYSPRVVKLLIDLIYTQVDIPYSTMIELLKLAVFVQYDQLLEYLVEEIRRLINDTNALQWLEVAHHCGCDALIWLTETFVREDFAKLHWKAICKGTRSDKEMLRYIQNSKMKRETKELVHIFIQKKKGEFILDVEKMILSDYLPEKDSLTDNMLSICNPSYSFVRNGVIYAVSIRYTNFAVFDLLKYRYVPSTWEQVGSYEFSYETDYGHFFYDGKSNLYLQMKLFSDMLIYKIDLISGTLCAGYVKIDIDKIGPYSRHFLTCEYQKLHLLNDGMYLFALDTVTRISDFDFDQSESHTVDKIPLSGKISGLSSVSLAKRTNQDMTFFESCNGTGYCFLPPEVWERDYWCIAKLDLQKRSWVYIADSNCYYVFNLVPCNKTICIESNNMDEENESCEIFFFNTAEEKVREGTVQLPVNGYGSYFNFPVYL